MSDDERTEGTIAHVNQARGFCFIASAVKRDNLFAHCTEFDSLDWQLIERNMRVTFVLALDRKGNQCAKQVELVDESSRSGVVVPLKSTPPPRGYTSAGS